MGAIYLIHNKVNNKDYVGKTMNDAQGRWSDHKYNYEHDVYDYPLYKSMKKYGIENFEFSIIEDGIETEELLNEREKYWIKELNTYIKNHHGYNCTLGGDGICTIDRNEVIQLWESGIGVSQIAEKTQHDRSSIRKILKTLDTYSEEEARKRAFIGRDCVISHEKKDINKKLIEDSAPGRHFYLDNGHILQFSLDGTFIEKYRNMYEAEEKSGVSSKTIWGAVNHKQKTAGSYQWRYEMDPDIPEDISNKYIHSYMVAQMSIDDKIISVYKNASEAERQTGINSVLIRRACRGLIKTAGQYKWKYITENEGGE